MHGVQMRPAQLAGAEGLLDALKVIAVAIFQDGLLAAVRADPDDPVAYDAGDPDTARIIEGQPVRESAVAEFRNDCPRAKPAIRSDIEGDGAPGEGLVHE